MLEDKIKKPLGLKKETEEEKLKESIGKVYGTEQSRNLLYLLKGTSKIKSRCKCCCYIPKWLLPKRDAKT